MKKWIWFFWFLVSNGFNTQKAIDDVKQVIRQYEWEEKISETCFCGYDGNECDDDCDCVCHEFECSCSDCNCKEE